MGFDISCFVARPLFYAGSFHDIPGQPHNHRDCNGTSGAYMTVLVFPIVLGKSVHLPEAMVQRCSAWPERLETQTVDLEGADRSWLTSPPISVFIAKAGEILKRVQDC